MILTFSLSLLALILFAILLNGARTALFNLTGGHVKSIEESKPELAQKTENWLNQRREYFFTIRLLAAISITLYSLITYHFLVIDNMFNVSNVGQVISFLGLFFFYHLSKELLGTIGLSSFGLSYLKLSMPIINICAKILSPYLFIISHLSKQQQENLNTEDQPSAEDEIMSLIEQDEENEELDLEDDEKRMIKGVLSLDDTSVKEIMTPRTAVDAISIEENLDQLRQFFINTTFSRIPVYKENIDDIVGIVHAKDLLDLESLEGLESFNSLIHPVKFVAESDRLDDVLEDFQKDKAHFAVVRDSHGGTSGIVTIEDILEEIVGEIQDEYDEEEEQNLISLPNGDFVLNARVLISELNERLKDKLPDEERYDTIGGYIYNQIGRIPYRGERIPFPYGTVLILEADETRINKLKLLIHDRETPQSQPA